MSDFCPNCRLAQEVCDAFTQGYDSPTDVMLRAFCAERWGRRSPMRMGMAAAYLGLELQQALDSTRYFPGSKAELGFIEGFNFAFSRQQEDFNHGKG